MAIDKVNEDNVLLETCTYCGTQTRVNPRAVEADKPVPCRMCGAPLKIELPDSRERRFRKRSEPVTCQICGTLAERRDVYYVDGILYCPLCNELSHRERNKRQQQTLMIMVIIGLIIAFLVVGLLTGTF